MKETDIRVFEAVAILLERGTVRFQNDVWESIGIKKQSIANIRAGVQHFRISHVRKLCQIYGFDANWILCISPHSVMFRMSDTTKYPPKIKKKNTNKTVNNKTEKMRLSNR